MSGKAWYTDGKVCLHMNGKTVNGTNRVFYINEGSELSLMGSGSAIGGAYASGSTAGGGVAYIKGTLNLYGPTITTNGKSGRTAKSGGVVYLTGGTLNMYSGAITGGHATNGGTLYLLGSSTANIHGGTLTGGTATSTGGAVYLKSSTLNLYGGTVIGGTASSSGGGLYLAEDATANLYGGTLTGGTATTNGGCIYLKADSTLNIAGTQITGGECGNSGGTLYASGSSQTVMSAGSISGGKSGSNGGCIYLYTNGVVDMSGGTIGAGADDTYATGSSFYVRTGGIVKLSGDASIHELRFPSIETLSISGKYTGTFTLKANSYPNGKVVGSAKDTDLTDANITIGDGSYYLVPWGEELRLSRLGEIDTKTLQAGYCEACQKDVQWILWDEEDCAIAKRTITGHYRVNADGCYLGQKTIGGTDRVCLDLNGKTLYADRAFDVNTGILNLVDTVGGGEIVGQGSNTTEASYGGVGYVRQSGEMNIYGGTYSYQQPTDDRHYVNRGGVFYVQGKWNLYGGEILGGAALTGSAVFGNAGTAYCSYLGFYGGTVTMGQSVPGETGTGLCVMTRGTVAIGGACRVDELLIEKATGSPALGDALQAEDTFSGSVLLQLPSYAGCADIGTCTSAPQGITLGNDSAASFLCIDGQLLAVSGTPKVVIFHADGTVTAYETLAAAISACATGDRLILMADSAESVSVDKLVHLDLNGFDVTGDISGTGTLACMDLKTADFTVADGDYGKLTGTVTCALTGVTAAAPCSDDHYIMIREGSGISFHRICLQITDSVLRPSVAGIYYSSNFCGDEKVSELVDSFGIALNAAEVPTADNMHTTSLYTVMDKALFNSDSTSCLLSGIMKTENEAADNLSRAAMPVYAGAYVRLTDGTVLYGNTVSTNLQEQAAAINAGWDDLNYTQKRAFVGMFEQFDTVMRDSSWSVSSAITIADRKVAIASTDYTPYLAPWTHNVVEEAKADGKIHYYFMAGEGSLLDVDFLKVPHHGYNTSSSFEFIEAVSPEVAMATGRLPIPSSVRSRYEDAGVTFLDDRTNGYVEVTGSADGTLEYVLSRTEATDETPEAGDDATPDGSED